MAGEIRNKLISQIRYKLQDVGRVKYESDIQFDNDLTNHQYEITRLFKIIKKDVEINLSAHQDVYPVDDSIASITSINFSNAEMNTIPANYIIPDLTVDKYVKVLDMSKFKSGDKMTLKAFVGAIEETDKISKTKDPIIPTIYHRHLINCVLSGYSTKELPFKSLEDVHAEIEQLAKKMMPINRTRTESGFRKLKW